MNSKGTKSTKAGTAPTMVRRLMRRLVGNNPWIPTIAVLVLYVSSGLLVLLGIFKLYLIISTLVTAPDFLKHIDLIPILSEFIGIIEVYLLAIIFKIFAVGIFILNVEEIKEYRGEQVDSIEELKVELAKAIVLFLAVFLVQKVVLWDDGVRTLYYGIIITLICAVLIAFTMVLQTNIRHKTLGQQFMSKKKEYDIFKKPVKSNGAEAKNPSLKSETLKKNE